MPLLGTLNLAKMVKFYAYATTVKNLFFLKGRMRQSPSLPVEQQAPFLNHSTLSSKRNPPGSFFFYDLLI